MWKALGRFFGLLVLIGFIAAAAGGPAEEANARQTQSWLVASAWNAVTGAVMAVVDVGGDEATSDETRG